MTAARPEMRAEVYGRLAELFSYPDKDLWESLADGTAQSELCGAVSAAIPGCSASLIALTDDLVVRSETAYTDLESAYLNAFELDAPSSPCPLYEGAHRHDTDRSGLLLEVKSFYQHFGLVMAKGFNSPEDHLSAELEFMAFLATKQAASEHEGRDSGPYLRAQRDFLTRHLGRWAPLLAEAAERKVASPFYRAMCRLLGSVVTADESQVSHQAAGC